MTIPDSSASHEAGFTLLELVAALTIMAVGIVAVIGVIGTSLRVAGEGDGRSRAVALATKESESLRALRYDQIGFGVTQAGYTPVFEGQATVTLAAAPFLVEPFGPDQLINGQRYSFERHVVWANAASTTAPGATYVQAYKRAVVVVNWTDRSATHTARQDAAVYPGGQGTYVGPMGAVTTTTVSTSGLLPSSPMLLAAAAGSPAENAVDLSWVAPLTSSPAITSWVIEYSSDGWATANQLTDTQPPTTTAFTANGLAASTTYQFRLAGRASTGVLSAWSPPTSITTAAPAVTQCQVGIVSITPNAIKRQNSGNTVLAANAVVTANTSGLCAGLHVTYNANASGTSDVYLAQGLGGVWTGLINGQSTSWDTGAHAMRLIDQSGASLASFTLTVCLKNASTCP